MHILSMRIRNILENCVYDDAKRERFVGFAFAQSLAFTLQLPTSKVESINSFFNTTHKSVVDGLISNFNEHFVVNVAEVQDLIKKFYTFRYNAVWNPTAGTTFAIMQGMMTRESNELPPFAMDMLRDNIDKPGFSKLEDMMWWFKTEWSEKHNLVEIPVPKE